MLAQLDFQKGIQWFQLISDPFKTGAIWNAAILDSSTSEGPGCKKDKIRELAISVYSGHMATRASLPYGTALELFCIPTEIYRWRKWAFIVENPRKYWWNSSWSYVEKRPKTKHYYDLSKYVDKISRSLGNRLKVKESQSASRKCFRHGRFLPILVLIREGLPVLIDTALCMQKDCRKLEWSLKRFLMQ